MSVVVYSPLTESEIDQILHLNAGVISESIQTLTGKLRVNLELTPALLEKLSTAVGLPLSNPVPAQLVKGDTLTHVDSGPSSFLSTFLFYLTTSPGHLVLGDTSYPIEKGAAYVFPSGLEHGTQGTGDTVRISIGPMSEQGFAVGRPPVAYFPSEADALSENYESVIGYGNYTVGTLINNEITTITQWRIATGTGSSSQSVVYNNGDVLADVLADDPYTYIYYNMYPGEIVPPCVNACVTFGSQVQATDRSDQDSVDFIRNKAIYVGQTENPIQFRDHATYIKYKKALIQLANRT